MRRFLGTLLTVVMLMSVLPPAALAAETATVSLSSGRVAAGGDVTLTVTIEDNPGLAACMLYIYYDTSVFSVDPAGDMGAAGAFRTSGGLLCNSVATAKANGRYNGDEGKDGVLALWYNGSGLDTTGDGDMMTVTLHASSAAANGDYTVELGYSAADTVNRSGERVALSTSSAVVAVTGGGASSGSGQTGSSQESGSSAAPQFSDISGSWAQAYIEDAARRGLVEGYAGLFRPEDSMTRAEFVTILWRASGEPQPTKASSFTDLDPEQTWYLDAVAWAEENGVVNGIGDGAFDPGGTVTREQLVTILHRQAGSPAGMEQMLTGVYDQMYPDSDQISPWAKAALYWSVYREIYCGQESASVGQTLAPTAEATRAQIAAMIVRYLDKQL